MRKITILAALFSELLTVSCGPKDGIYEFDLFSTNDVHGTWFDSTYTSSRVRPSLMAVGRYVDSVRAVNGAESVILLDGGDCLQGDNAAYYFKEACASDKSFSQYISLAFTAVRVHEHRSFSVTHYNLTDSAAVSQGKNMC